MTKKDELDNEWITGEENEDLFPKAGAAYPTADQAAMDDILEHPVMVKDYVIRESINGEFAIMLVREKKAQNDWSVPCGGKIVLEWLEYLRENKRFPVIAVFVKEKSKSHPGLSYYVPMSTSTYKAWKEKKGSK